MEYRSTKTKENPMQRTIRALACTGLIASLAACVITPPPRASAPRPNPHEFATQRYGQINERIDNLSRRIDGHVDAGAYPPPDGMALHHRLDVIREEARDMSAGHGGGLSGDEQHVLDQELDAAARAIGE
jgi:hypothetical protein